MKKFFFITVLFLKITLIVYYTQAQSKETAGIYYTPSDFKSGTYKKLDCSSKNKLELNNLFASNVIIVKDNNIKTKIKKSSVYGYHTCSGENFRFYHNEPEPFKILDTGGIYIYSHYYNENPVKGKASTIRVKGLYYSLMPDSEIKSLTKESILSDFPDNLKLRLWLDSLTKSADLLEKNGRGKLIIQILIND